MMKMSMMTYEEAAADAARVIAELDALYGSPEEHKARALHELAYQLRKAERVKQQKEQEQRIAKHQTMLAAREGERQQPRMRTEEEWRKAMNAFNAANPGWLAWFDERLKAAYADGAVELAAFNALPETLSVEELRAKEEEVRTPFGHLFLLLGKLTSDLRTEIRKEQIEPLRQELKQHAAVADDERGKLRSELDGKQQQIDALRAKLSQQSAELERRIAVLEARISEQQRIADIEAHLAARQDAKNAAKKGAKGDRGEKDERGATGPAGKDGVLHTPADRHQALGSQWRRLACPRGDDGRQPRAEA
jgi:hypothetical protein